MTKRIDETIPKRCTICDLIKLPHEFHRGTRRKDGTYYREPMCRKCRNKQAGEYYKLHPEKKKIWKKRTNVKYYEKIRSDPVELMKRRIRGSKRKAELGGWKKCNISVKELLDSFTGFCQNPNCGVPESECTQRLCMDHNHKTGEFRGWLCHKCNRAAGLLDDSHEKIFGLACFMGQGSVVCHG